MNKSCVFFSFRFVPDKGFEGADSSGRGDGPVAFEQHHQDTNFDPFQIDDFLGNLKTGGDKNNSSSNSSKRHQQEEDSSHSKKHSSSSASSKDKDHESSKKKRK